MRCCTVGQAGEPRSVILSCGQTMYPPTNLRSQLFFSMILFAMISSCTASSPQVSVAPTNSFPVETQTAIAKVTWGASYRSTSHAYQTSRAHARLTETILATGSSPAATSTLTPTIKPSATATFEVISKWKIFRQEDLGFEFEFPVEFGDGNYVSCRVYTRDETDGYYFRLGARIELLVRIATDESLAKDVADYIEDRSQPGEWEVTNQENSTVGGNQAITIEYRFGMTNRYGTSTFTKAGGWLYHFNYSAGVDCSYPGGISEFEAYFHLLESFRFLKLPGND